jgi:hypothetical protein
MTKLIKYFKSGANLVPFYVIAVYLMFIGTDIYTTYKTSPDLKFETNWIIRYFDLNYSHMIILSCTYACIGISSLYISRGYFDHFFRDYQHPKSTVIYQIFHTRNLFFSYGLFGFFYLHFFISIYCTINNYLGYIYIFDHSNPLINIARSYIESMHLGVTNYHIYSQTTVSLFGYAYAFYKIKRLVFKASISSNQGQLLEDVLNAGPKG